MAINWLMTGAVAAALAVIAGAFGAHGLASRLDAHALGLWETASRYLMYGALALIQVGLFARTGAKVDGPGWSLLVGMVIFSGTVFALALGSPRVLGAITPIGGVLLIVGFLWLAWAAAR